MVGYCWGRNFKIGYGYNYSLGLLIPMEGTPLITELWNLESSSYYISDLSSTDSYRSQFICFLLEPNYKKLLDFQITFDDTQYWLIYCRFWRRGEYSDEFPKYPYNCSHFIHNLFSGVDLCVLLPKLEFPKDKEEVRLYVLSTTNNIHFRWKSYLKKELLMKLKDKLDAKF